MDGEKPMPPRNFVRRNGYNVIPVAEAEYPRWIVGLRLAGVPSHGIVGIVGEPIGKVRRTLAEYGSHDGRAIYHLSKGSREALLLPWYVPDRSPDPDEPRLDAYDILTGDIGAGYPPLPAGHEPFFAWQR